MICEDCGNLLEDCECEEDESMGEREFRDIYGDNIGETGYDGDGY